MDSEDSSENEEARGNREPYRRDSRDSEHDSNLDDRAWEEDVRGSREDESEEDQITKVSYSGAELPNSRSNPNQNQIKPKIWRAL